MCGRDNISLAPGPGWAETPWRGCFLNQKATFQDTVIHPWRPADPELGYLYEHRDPSLNQTQDPTCEQGYTSPVVVPP